MVIDAFLPQGEDTFVTLSDNMSLRGKANKGVRHFMGIPFASPPLGDLRWRSPQYPAPAWTGTRDALLPGDICMQVRLLLAQHRPSHRACGLNSTLNQQVSLYAGVLSRSCPLHPHPLMVAMFTVLSLPFIPFQG